MRTLGPAKRFLLLPVSEKAGLVRVNLKHGGTLIDAVYARLCPPEEQDYAEVIRTQSFADEGLTLAVYVESCPDTEGGVSVLTPCECSRLESYPAFADEIDAYDEPCRPWVHFSLVRGWINDTNGPILIDGLITCSISSRPAIRTRHGSSAHGDTPFPKTFSTGQRSIPSSVRPAPLPAVPLSAGLTASPASASATACMKAPTAAYLSAQCTVSRFRRRSQDFLGRRCRALCPDLPWAPRRRKIPFL